MTSDITIHDDPSPADVEAVGCGLDEANDAARVLQDVRPLAAFARELDELVGGAVGRTWGECCELRYLWVRAEDRRRGLGLQLLQAFEQRARERGCGVIYLKTFSFQAPALYAAQGYRVAFELRGYTHAVAKFLMTKELVRRDGAR